MIHGYTAEKRFENGKPTLYINGEKTLPMIYALTDIPAFETSTEEARRNMRHFAQQGIHFIQAHVFLYKGWHKVTGYDIDNVIGVLDGVLAADKDAAIMLRLHLGAPYWWMRDNPDEICVFRSGEGDYVDNGEYERLVAGDEERYMRASIASEKWKADTGAVLAEFCRRIADAEEGKHIVAIQIAGGVYAEWHQWGFNHHPDYSRPMTAYFRRWLQEKYKTDEALQDAWKRDDMTLDTAVLAPPETRHLRADHSYDVAEDGVTYRVPRDDVYAVDSLRAMHSATVDAIGHFSDIVKENWPRPVLTGAFYGYYDGGFSAASVGGHLDVQRLCESGKIDFMAAPFPYHPYIRDVEGVTIARSFLESMRLNNILWLTEMDCAPVGTKDYVGGDPALLEENVAVLKSHVLEPFTRGHGMWYFDHRMFPSNIYVKKGWWDTPRFMQEIGAMREVCEKQTLDAYTPSADVLVVCDAEYYYYMIHQNMTHYGVMYPFFYALGKSGVCYDAVYLHDLPKVEVERYRAVVFMSTVRLDNSMRKWIRENLEKNGRHLIWLHASGFMDDDRVSVDLMTDAIGINCVPHAPADRMIMDTIKPTTIVSNEPFDPAFAVCDTAATVLARYADGEVAAAQKNGDDHTSITFQLPPTDADVLRELFRNAGAHIYSEAGDALLVGGNMVIATVPHGGDVAITLKNGTKIKEHFTVATTAIYDATTGVRLG